PAPQLPPGFKSLNAPGSEAPPTAPTTEGGGPPLPEGYYPITGPPPPGYFDAPPGPNAPPGMAPIPAAPPPTP
ncbi:MAG: hypothetical protein WAL26_19790, partial [Mycobacterium sp.]